MNEYRLMCVGHCESISADTTAAAIAAAKKYADKYNIHSFVLLDRNADVVYYQ